MIDVFECEKKVQSLQAENKELIFRVEEAEITAEHFNQLYKVEQNQHVDSKAENKELREAGIDLCNKMYGSVDDYEKELNNLFRTLTKI